MARPVRSGARNPQLAQAYLRDADHASGPLPRTFVVATVTAALVVAAPATALLLATRLPFFSIDHGAGALSRELPLLVDEERFRDVKFSVVEFFVTVSVVIDASVVSPLGEHPEQTTFADPDCVDDDSSGLTNARTVAESSPGLTVEVELSAAMLALCCK